MSEEDSNILIQLRDQIARHFNLEELQALAFELEIDWDELPGRTKSPRIQALLIQLAQRQRLADLIHLLQQKRSAQTWPTPPLPEEQLQLAERLGQTDDPLATLMKHSEEALQGVVAIKALLAKQWQGLMLFPQFATPIENFLISYLGTEKEPVPFGGREAELQRLEEWRRQSERPRLLLTAPAGRGKSALLVRWSQRLAQQADVAVVFMPISARFSTNREEVTFACLAIRLAHLYGKEIPTDFAHFTPQLWRGLVSDYLRESLPDGRQLLLILDGLDEAAWKGYEDIFPLQLAPDVRLVVSARYKVGEVAEPGPWLQRLGWDRFADLAETLTLPELTPAGVRDVLIRMGCPLDELGAQVDIVSELHRLSEGDPLLVELYVKDLWSQGEAVTRLKPTDLAVIQPGYAGFFDKWWADQEKLWGQEKPLLQSLTRMLLNLLAAAWGPLLLDDVQEILSEDPLAADSVLIQEALKPLARFVLGDGREQGYVLAHPRLGDYFWEKLSRRDQERWEGIFIHWGQMVLQQLRDGQLSYETVSLYLLQYYSSHLQRRAASLTTYLSLLSYEWLQAWHKRTGTYAAFLRDVDSVWEQLRVANRAAVAAGKAAPYIGQEIRCALYHASVHSLAENLPDELLVALLRHQLRVRPKERIWTEEQILVYARHKHELVQRCHTLIKLALELPQERCTPLLIEVEELASHIEDERSRAGVLSALAPHLPQLQQAEVLNQFLSAASHIKDEWSRAGVLSALASHLPQVVLERTSQIKNESGRAEVLIALAPHLPQAVLEIASHIEDERNRVVILSALAPHLPQAVLESASHIEDERSRVVMLIALAPHLPQAVLEITSHIEDERSRVAMLRVLAPHLPQAVLESASHIEDERSRVVILSALAPHLPQTVLESASHVEDERSRAGVLSALAPHLPQTVLESASHIKNERSRAEVLIALAPHLPQTVLESASHIKNERSRAEVLIALAPHLPQLQQAEVLNKHLNTASHIEDERRRAEVLIVLAPYLPQAVLERTSHIKDELRLVRVLRALASHLPQAVLESASRIKNELWRAEMLIALAPHLPPSVFASQIKNELRLIRVLSVMVSDLPQLQQTEALNQLLNVAIQIDDKRRQAEVLIALAPYLPQAVLGGTSQIKDELRLVRVLIALAPYLPQAVLERTSHIEDERTRDGVLIALVPHLSQLQRAEVLNQLLNAVSYIKNERNRAEMLKVIAPYLPQAVLERTSHIGDKRSRAEVVKVLASYLPQLQRAEVLNQALQAACHIEDEEQRAEVLRVLAPQLPQAVLEGASRIEDEGSRVRVLSALAPHLPQAILESASNIEDEWRRAGVLRVLAPYLPQAVLEGTSQIKDEWRRAEVLKVLAPHLPQAVLEGTRYIKNERRRIEVLITLAPHLPQVQQAEVLNKHLNTASHIEDERRRAEVLTALAPQLPQVVLEGASRIEDERRRAEVLTALAPHLPQDVLESASYIEIEEKQAEVLSALAPHLPSAVLESASHIENESGRAGVLKVINEQLAPWSLMELCADWQMFLSVAARRNRENLLVDIENCVPMIERLGGKVGLAEVLQAIVNVGNWWP